MNPKPSAKKRKLDRTVTGDVTPPPSRKKAAMSRKECSVCYDDVNKNRFPKLPHVQDDNNVHTSDVCFKCFKEHLEVEVKAKGSDAVSCPQCKKQLEESEVRKLASSFSYQEYATRLLTGIEC